MFCILCGSELKEGQDFCTKCGTPRTKDVIPPAKTTDIQNVNTINQNNVVIEDNKTKIKERKIKFSEKTSESISKESESDGIGGRAHNNLIIALILLVSFILILGAGSLIFFVKAFGLFLPENEKVLLAFSNTMKSKTVLLSSLKDVGKLVNDDFTVLFDAEMPYICISDGDISSNEEILQVSATVDIAGADTKQCLAELNDNNFKLYIPELNDYCISYPYKENFYEYDDPTYFSVGNDNGIAPLLRVLNKINHKNQAMIKASDKEALKAWWDELDFEVQKGEKIKIKSASKKCTCYSTEINTQELLDLCDILEEVYNDNGYLLLLDELHILRSEPVLMNMRDRIDEGSIENMAIDFYVCKGKIARIELLVSDGIVRIDFSGRDFPWAETIVSINDSNNKFEPIFELNYNNNGEFEKYTAKVMNADESVLNLKYTTDTGRYNLKVGSNNDTWLSVGGVLKTDNTTADFKINEIEIYGNKEDFLINSTIKKGVEFSNFPEGEIEFTSININYLIDLFSGNEMVMD